jgi:hypothetical protein
MTDLTNSKGMSFNQQNFSSFDGKKAHELATLIGSAYTQFEQQGKNTWKPPIEHTKVVDLTHDNRSQVFGFISQNKQEAFIIIRGTRTAYEWYNNTVMSHEEYFSIENKKWGITTKGFNSIYVDIREEIKLAFSALNNAKHIFIAGHSLGGALATLVIPDLIDLGIKPDKITAYTFASPRCCDRELATNLNNSGVKHWRIANTEDIVPTLPGATANIFSPYGGRTQEEVDNKADDENFIVRTYKDLKAKGMKSLLHTGTPIYFTIGTDSIEDNHNLEFVYMQGIGQPPASLN